MPDRGAIAAMFAVPAMPIEEHQMRRGATIHRLVHPKQILHRCTGAALGLWLERVDHDADHGSRRLLARLRRLQSSIRN